ncbi:MAG: hypothetical protein LUC32_07635 [Clostridiales bacterium]|nr:hypothetical protein [Clostridiales bacterium]
MIKCAKCGKRYDYDRYNGICPSCGRYNRQDSAVLESELHERYDEDPAHSEQSHVRVHEKNYDTYRHDTDGKRRKDRDFWETDKKPKKHRMIGVLIGIIIVIVIVAVLGFTGIFTANFAENVLDELGIDMTEITDGTDFVWEEYEEDEPVAVEIPEEEDAASSAAAEGDIRIDFAYMDRIDTPLKDVDWEDEYYIDITDEDLEEILISDDMYADGAFFLVTICLQNDSDEDFDATSVTEDHLVFSEQEQTGWTDSSLKNFHTYWETIEASDYGYLDCLIYIPDEVTESGGEEGYVTITLDCTIYPDGQEDAYVDSYELLYYPD